jgi:uncharacterized membrane protein
MEKLMNKGRLEAFSDGVIAIIITIMVLELKVPEGDNLQALLPIAPVFLSYILSFIYLGIYWNNHHHLFQAVEKIEGRVLLANLHLLFWLSLIPFATAWMGENHFSTWPVALYGLALLLAAFSYSILTKVLLKYHNKDSVLAIAIGDGRKEKISLAIYAAAISVSFINSWIAFGLYSVIAMIWVIPDNRIEKLFKKGE